MHSALDMKATLAGNHPHLLYLLATALRPRMLMTLDTEGKLLPVPVRVGQAVDTVAQVSSLSRSSRHVPRSQQHWVALVMQHNPSFHDVFLFSGNSRCVFECLVIHLHYREDPTSQDPIIPG